ncbi:MAG: hypothetical protein M3Q58_08510, partial [Bacteroidota bacterium]|nr:hypothetical protein [Bacteroidota bacterium]
TLNNPQNHFNVQYKTMNKGYLESGFRVNNLIVSNIFGLGAGVFYRYGPYSNIYLKDNIAAKLTFSLAF